MYLWWIDDKGCTFGGLMIKDVPLVEFIYPVFTCMPDGVALGDSGLLLCPLSVERY